MAPPQPPSLKLPKPPTDLRASRKGEHVELIWTLPTTTTDRQRIQQLGPTDICRGSVEHLSECGQPVGAAPAEMLFTPGKSKRPSRQKTSESYSDTLPSTVLSDNPSATVTYAVEVLNDNGRGAGLSNQVHVLTIRTLPPPQNFSARVTAQGVVLTWIPVFAPPTTDLHYINRVYRRPLGGSESTVVGSVTASQAGPETLTDSNIEWEKTYEYWANSVTLVAQSGQKETEIEGEDTPRLQVFANDVFPPAVPTGLQAAFSGPGQRPFIDLIWAPVTDADLNGYNVYRSEDGTAWRKLNPEPLKVSAYRDSDISAGKIYSYSVSAIDLRGNESARSVETSQPVP